MGLTWGFWDASIFDLNPNIILGADVFYDASGKICAFEILICSLLPIWFVGSSWNVVSGFAGKPLMTSLRPSHICSRVLQDQSSLRLIIIEGILISSVCSDCGLHNLLVMMFFFSPHPIFTYSFCFWHTAVGIILLSSWWWNGDWSVWSLLMAFHSCHIIKLVS